LENNYENLEGLTLEVSGDSHEVKDLADERFTTGKFGPGKYEVAATAKYEYADVKDNAEVSLFDSENFTKSIEMDLYAQNVYLYTKHPNTKLKIDGELTDIVFEDTIEFGPVSSDAKIQAIVEFPWGESESKEYNVSESSDFSVDVPVLGDEEVKDELTTLL